MSEKSGFQNFLSSFSDLARLPRALWFVIGAFVIDTAAYYGVLTLMTVFLHSDLGWSDQRSGVTVSVFTMLVTLFMLGVGSYAERFFSHFCSPLVDALSTRYLRILARESVLL